MVNEENMDVTDPSSSHFIKELLIIFDNIIDDIVIVHLITYMIYIDYNNFIEDEIED